MSALPRVAYFSMEYGLHERFKIYGGGLGILAGDILKAAHDIKAPMVGVGILWRQGYTKQSLDENGFPQDTFAEQKYDFLKDTGVEVSVRIRKQTVRLKVWLCDAFSNAPLYLLDAYLPKNPDSLITGQLYGWFEEERIAQEIILGVGGIKALRALDIDVDIYHFNDSHPIFAALYLWKEHFDACGDYETARELVQQQCRFTTHTPVEAGNEAHPIATLRYMGADFGIPANELRALAGNPFNMTVAGLRLSRQSSAVSLLHGETAREMWAHVKDTPPIIGITNGVHLPTWQDKSIPGASGEGLWQAHEALKRSLLDEIKARTGVSLAQKPLTIGFARRAAAYKRGNLILKDMDTIGRLMRNGRLQLIYALKAHPNDMDGKEIIADLAAFSMQYPGQMVFLEDYAMDIAKRLTRGCDVWLNTPLRPMEACGTSGMKAALNGVLNFSVLDGWWAEAANHGVNGFCIGGGYEGPDADEVDSASLIKVLTEEILPCFEEDKPRWQQMMLGSIQMAQDGFDARRNVEDYYNLLYK